VDGHRDITLDWLLSVVLVHLVIRLCHHLRGLRSASLVSRGSLLLCRGVNERGAVCGSQIS
jgi:hypothetical protein